MSAFPALQLHLTVPKHVRDRAGPAGKAPINCPWMAPAAQSGCRRRMRTLLIHWSSVPIASSPLGCSRAAGGALALTWLPRRAFLVAEVMKRAPGQEW